DGPSPTRPRPGSEEMPGQGGRLDRETPVREAEGRVHTGDAFLVYVAGAGNAQARSGSADRCQAAGEVKRPELFARSWGRHSCLPHLKKSSPLKGLWSRATPGGYCKLIRAAQQLAGCARCAGIASPATRSPRRRTATPGGRPSAPDADAGAPRRATPATPTGRSAPACWG